MGYIILSLSYIPSSKTKACSNIDNSIYFFELVHNFIGPPRHHISKSLEWKHLKMTQGFGCKGDLCQRFYSEDLGHVVEHLRGTHGYRFFSRPHALGTPDSHGHLWWCYGCDGRSGNDHRSYNSGRAMWDHLNRCHDSCMDTIEILT